VIEDLGNLGDFVGGIAVVVTLVYLAIQVRQNTVQLRRASDLASVEAGDLTVQAFSRFRERIVADAGVAELYLKGLRDPDMLDAAERLRFNMLLQELFYVLASSSRRLLAQGGYDVAQTLRILGVEATLAQPGIAKWWKANRGGLPPEFVERVESHISIDAASTQDGRGEAGRAGE